MLKTACNFIGSPMRRHTRRFARDERGALLIFTLMLLVLMIMMGGFAVDLMRYEQKRTKLSNTLDRCTLMAASLTNQLDPEAVVRDCVDKMGMSDQLAAVEVSQGENFRDVRSSGRVDTQPFFMHMIGIDDFDAVGSSRAEQRITNVEIVLVLDVSGSMTGAKIANLRTAASEFVQTLLANDTENRFSVTIVPYNAQVNLGPALRAKYNATNLHGVANVNCLEVPVSAYGSLALSRSVPMPMSAYSDLIYGTNQVANYVGWADTSVARMTPGSPWCRNTTANIVRLPSNNVAQLQAQINGLQAGGNTSIMLGMKWGVTLIDPSARGMFSELVAESAIPATFAGRPFDYTDDQAMKVIVLMTDGEHVAHNKTNDAVKTGLSPIWRSAGDGNYSILHPTRAGPNKYWVPHRTEWRATAWNSGGGTAQMAWNEVWANQRQSWVAWQLYARALGTNNATRTNAYNAAMTSFQSQYASVADMNAQLQQSCALVKAQDVTVYGIAFEAPANGQAQISQCASSPSHYFNAQGLEIQSAFRAIASNITQLKLTQ